MQHLQQQMAQGPPQGPPGAQWGPHGPRPPMMGGPPGGPHPPPGMRPPSQVSFCFEIPP